MDAEEILTTAKSSTEHPHGWVVLPLSPSKVIWGIVGWTLGILIGLGLLAGVASMVIPSNYEHGFSGVFFTTLLLAMLLFIGLGSGWALFVDVYRLMQVDKHIIVITPEIFVKQEGENIICVPFTYMRNVTARGTPPPDRTPPQESATRHMVMGNIAGFFVGQSPNTRSRRRPRRTPTSLAFIDTRTDREVTVVTDSAYGDPFMIAALLKQYASAVV